MLGSNETLIGPLVYLVWTQVLNRVMLQPLLSHLHLHRLTLRLCLLSVQHLLVGIASVRDPVGKAHDL